jgi:predicted nucleic acid-binding protein
MKLVIDSNRIIAALIRDSTNRRIILSQRFQFVCPPEMVDEILKYKDFIIKKAKSTDKQFDELFSLILDELRISDIEKMYKFIPKAEAIMKEIDPKDVWFIAVALLEQTDGIWTEDGHFLKQNAVKIYSTKDLMMYLD